MIKKPISFTSLTVFTSGLLFLSGLLFGQTINHPFPNHTVYSENHIKPDQYTQSELDDQTKSFYDEWKSVYLRNDCSDTNQYYVFSGGDAINVSEAQGYGMMITACFAGYDTNAQIYFDGLYRFYKSHPSNINNILMDWQQVTCNDISTYDDDAASDGDIDIAFALLLAHSQWNSSGEINYLSESQTLINAIMQDEINHNTWTVKLGDWCDAGEADYYYGTRPSDFITDHFKVFSCISNNSNWNNVTESCYSLIENMQTNFSPATGLIPDFIINTNTEPNPAEANYLEDKYDGSYYYNSCRVPWRLGNDYLINNDARAKYAVSKINSWLLSASDGNVNNISNGYKLDGTPIYRWNDATYIGPICVGAMADTTKQLWLNSLYEELLVNNKLTDGDYYSNTIKLLSMITISGNYWVPECPASETNHFNTQNEDIAIYSIGSQGVINIDLNNQQLIQQKLICKIRDVSGKLLISEDIIHDHQQIDISGFQSGTYIVSLNTKNMILLSKRIIKV